MKNTVGTLEFEYENSLKKIEYSLDLEPGYAGIPIIYIADRNQRNYTFVRGTVYGWSPLGKPPSWPNQFVQSLFAAFEEEYQKTIAVI